MIYFNNHLTHVAEMLQALTVSGIVGAIGYKLMLAKSSHSGFVFLIGSGLYLSRRNFRKVLYAPIIELTSQVASLNPADLGKRIPIQKNSAPEINTLTMTINRLLTSIEERQKELENRVSERTMELQAMNEELNAVNETLVLLGKEPAVMNGKKTRI